MKLRPRRLRLNNSIRDLVAENSIKKSDLIYPVFIRDKTKEKETIKSMPNIFRHNTDSLFFELEALVENGLKAVAIFPVIEEQLKSNDAKESYNPNGITQRTISKIKKEFPELIVVSDIALDPYTIHGHDGIIEDEKVINDKTVEILCKMALVQAEAGADIVAPSDMMDGRVAAIRKSMEDNGFQDTLIMSYSAKYASCLYGPFRDALGSLGSANQNKSKTLFFQKTTLKDKKTYQMNPANSREAIKELKLDISEGADIVMVKPASWYLDIIHQFRQNTDLPVAAYQVSGEYSMIHAAAEKGYIDLNHAIIESLISIKRSGADLILSYFTKDFLQTS